MVSILRSFPSIGSNIQGLFLILAVILKDFSKSFLHHHGTIIYKDSSNIVLLKKIIGKRQNREFLIEALVRAWKAQFSIIQISFHIFE
jgi:hypothetical protein